MNVNTSIGQPANDHPCDAQSLIGDGSCITASTVDATPDLDDPGCMEMNGASVWYSVTISPDMDTLHINLTNINVPGMQVGSINVYTFDPDCNGDLNQIPGGDFCGSIDGASLTINDVIPGTTYFIEISTVIFEQGEFEVCVLEAGPLICVTESTCEDPQPLTFDLPALNVCETGCLNDADPGPTSSQDSCFNMPNETVWYSIDLPPIIPPSSLPAQATITVMTSAIEEFPADPHIAVFQDCDQLIQVACDYGAFSHADANNPTGPVEIFSTAVVSFPVLDYDPGQPFLIAISYVGEKAPDDFELCVSVGTLCNAESEITVMNTSFGSPLEGPYAPGEEVEICLRILDWNSGNNSSNCNWLHGLVPEFGECWDPVSFDDDGQPVDITLPMTNISGEGQWEWFGAGIVSYNFWAVPGYLPPNSLVGAGWYYIRHEGEIAQCDDITNPNCTRGDGRDCDDESVSIWQVCFVLTTKSWPECDIEENTVCDVSFRTFGDGETGGYMQVGCVYDQEWEIELDLECCEQPFFEPTITQFNCSDTEISIDLISSLDPDVEYVWEVSPNDVGATPCDADCPTTIQQTLTNDSSVPVSVTYTITPTTISNGCRGEPYPVEVEINPRLSVIIPPRPTICAGSCATINPVVFGGESPYNYWWDGLGSGIAQVVCPEVTTDYFLTVTDANGCTATATTTINTTPVLTVAIGKDPNTDQICENDPDFPIELTAEVTEGGSGFYVWAWNTGEFTQTIEAPESDAYCITVIDALTQCTGEICQTITVHPAPEPAIEDPGILCDAEDQVCLKAEPEGGDWLSDSISINQNGCISPSNAGPGIFEVCYDYTDPETMCDSTTCIEVEIIGAPVFDSIPDTIVCDVFILPVITGINLSGGAAYYDGLGGTGNMYNPGDEIDSSTLMYIYENVGDSICITQDSFFITINSSPNAAFSYVSPLCIGDTAIISYNGNASNFASYQWDFGDAIYVNGSGAGPYEVLWDAVGTHDVSLTVNDRDCISPENIQSIVIEQLMSDPVVSCQTTTTEIIFSWSDVPGATSYSVNDITGPSGVLNGNTYTVSGLNPMDAVTIEVVALSDGVCGSSSIEVTCNAIDCPDIQLDIQAVPEICLTPLTVVVNLQVDITGSDGSGSGEWVGLFTTPEGIFDPIAAGPGFYLIGYNFNEVACNYSESVEVVVHESPSALFSVNQEICEEDFATALYLGNSDPLAIYTWDFDGGTIINGTAGVGPGPHEIEWIDGGTKVISLEVLENGCLSNVQLENIDVIPSLEQPIITCETTTEGITFTWEDVAGSSGFIVNPIDGPMGTINGNSYIVGNLDPETSVTISVEALSSGPCPNTLSVATECRTEICALPDFIIDNSTDTICLDQGAGFVDLDVIFDPVIGNGTGVWSGNGIIDTDLGIFDPDIAGLGQHSISYQYTELNCSETIQDIIEIFEIPEAGFVASDTICISEIADVTFISANTTGTFYWEFDNGTIISGSNEGPYEISWDSPGDKLISLLLERNSCDSPIATFPVYVEDTLNDIIIDCSENYEDVTFTWNDIPGVTSYEIYINGDLVTVQTGTEYIAGGLSPGEMVEIEIIALNAGRCANKISSTLCAANNCPPIDLQIVPGDTSLCLSTDALSFDLDSVITGGLGSGNGIGTWDGPGTNPTTGMFDPSGAGVGTHTINFYFDELDCLAETSIEIEILEQPRADFNLTNRICVEDTATIEFIGIAGGSADFDWDLLGGTIQQIGPNLYNVWWDTPGTYDISLIVLENGCTSEQRFNQIIVEPSLEEPVIMCQANSESIDISWNAVDCATNYEIYLDTGNGLELVATQTTTIYDIDGLDPEQVIDIQIVALSDCACPSVATLEACSTSSCPAIDVTIDPISSFCSSEIVDPFQLTVTVLGGDGSGQASWSGDGVNNDGVFDPSQVGIGLSQISYSYSELNCSYSDEIIIEIFDEPIASFDVSDPICYGDNNGSITVNASGGTEDYTYYLNNSSSINNTFSNLSPGLYTMIVEDANGCRYEEVIQIFAPIDPSLDIDGPLSIFVGNEGILEINTNIPAGAIDQITWEENGVSICDGCQEVVVNPESTSEYCVTIEFDGACVIQECINLRVDIFKRIYAPNVFSPNDDGINDYFTIYTNNVAQQINYLRIYDRWGEMVFETTDIPTDVEEKGWDGKFNDESLSPGVYVFVAELMYTSTNFELVTGDVTLLK